MRRPSQGIRYPFTLPGIARCSHAKNIDDPASLFLDHKGLQPVGAGAGADGSYRNFAAAMSVFSLQIECPIEDRALAAETHLAQQGSVAQ